MHISSELLHYVGNILLSSSNKRQITNRDGVRRPIGHWQTSESLLRYNPTMNITGYLWGVTTMLYSKHFVTFKAWGLYSKSVIDYPSIYALIVIIHANFQTLINLQMEAKSFCSKFNKWIFCRPKWIYYSFHVYNKFNVFVILVLFLRTPLKWAYRTGNLYALKDLNLI